MRTLAKGVQGRSALRPCHLRWQCLAPGPWGAPASHRSVGVSARLGEAWGSGGEFAGAYSNTPLPRSVVMLGSLHRGVRGAPASHRSLPFAARPGEAWDGGEGFAGAYCNTPLPRSVAMFGLSASVAFVGFASQPPFRTRRRSNGSGRGRGSAIVGIRLGSTYRCWRVTWCFAAGGVLIRDKDHFRGEDQANQQETDQPGVQGRRGAATTEGGAPGRGPGWSEDD